MFSLLLLMIISKHYSTYTLFIAFLSKTLFYLHKFLIKSESSRKYEKEEMKNVRRRGRQREPCVHPKGPFAVSDQAGKPLRLHRPSRFTSWLPDWLPDSMADTWIKVSRLSLIPSPKQQTVLLDEQKGLFVFVFLVFRRSSSPLLCIFDLNLILWGICKGGNGFR